MDGVTRWILCTFCGQKVCTGDHSKAIAAERAMLEVGWAGLTDDERAELRKWRD